MNIIKKKNAKDYSVNSVDFIATYSIANELVLCVCRSIYGQRANASAQARIGPVPTSEYSQFFSGYSLLWFI